MNAKKIMVSFLAIATLLFLAATVSAVEITDNWAIEVNGIDFANSANYPPALDNEISVVAGETVSVRVYFTANTSTSNVRIKAELDGDKESVDAVTTSFDVIDGMRYVKTLTLKVPYELAKEISGDLTLSLKIWNGDYKSEVRDLVLTVQRPSYNADVKSVIVSSNLEAGQISPVEIVLRNNGYNDLEDVYVTVRILELGIEKSKYFGDLVAQGDDADTVSGTVYLNVPYDVAAGIYILEVEVSNEDFSDVVKKQVAIQNGFPEVAVRSGNNLLVLNPSNQLRVYKIVYPAEETLVVVQAGSSKLVPIQTGAGEYNFDVFVFSGNELVGTVKFSGIERTSVSSPVVLLTVILGIVFLVLLVVLIVLITKKPQKTEEFGESYY